jgi:UDP-glucose 4-epimerase
MLPTWCGPTWLQHDFTGAINLGTGIETDVNTLFHHLRRLCGSTAPEQHGSAKPGEQHRSVIDNRFAQRTLGWHPEVGLEDGLRETVAFFQTRVVANQRPR